MNTITKSILLLYKQDTMLYKCENYIVQMWCKNCVAIFVFCVSLFVLPLYVLTFYPSASFFCSVHSLSSHTCLHSVNYPYVSTFHSTQLLFNQSSSTTSRPFVVYPGCHAVLLLLFCYFCHYVCLFFDKFSLVYSLCLPASLGPTFT